MRRTSSTILLVENNPRDVLRIVYAFARAGHSAPIESSGNYDDAVAQLEGTGGYADLALFPTPGLLMVDLNLDQGSGFQVLEWIQNSGELAGLPSVVLSSSRQPRDIQRAYALGAHDYRVKPASINGLCEIVRGIEAYWLELRREARPSQRPETEGGRPKIESGSTK